MGQEQIRQFEPALQPIFRHAVYYPENSYVLDNFRLVRAAARVFAENGGTTASFYEPEAYRRLRAVRTRVDPDGLFQANHEVPASTSAA